MQIPTSAGMLANSVLPVTPTQGGLVPQVAETAGSASFAPVDAVTDSRRSRVVPEQQAQPTANPESAGSKASRNKPVETEPREQGAEQGSDHNSERSASETNSEKSSEVKQQERAQERQQQQDLEIIRSLAQREREVHAHENAHSAVGGQYAGSANYSYQRGPDGVNYAVSGEVSIDVGMIPGDPAATLEKMKIVQRAALAPAEPSPQDRKVAAIAAQQASQARAELAIEGRNSTGPATGEADESEKAEPIFAAFKEALPSTSEAKAQKPEVESQPLSDQTLFQAANDRIAKINEILVAISQNNTRQASGQLLNDVV